MKLLNYLKTVLYTHYIDKIKILYIHYLYFIILLSISIIYNCSILNVKSPIFNEKSPIHIGFFDFKI